MGRSLKRVIGTVLALAMVMVGLTGCSSKQAGPVILKFAAQADSTPATQAVVDAFNASQTKYKVEWQQFTNDSGQMHDQLLTSLSSNSSDYDVLSCDVTWAGEFAAAGYLMPLDDKMSTAGLNAADFNKGSMAAGSYEGKQYTLPFFPDVGILYFRSDIVSKADAAKLESGNYTYDDLYAMAMKYKGTKGTTTGFAFQAKQYEGLTCNVNEFTANFKDLQGGLETMKKFVTSKAVPADVLNYNEGSTDANFDQGKSVFARNWPYQYGTIKAGNLPVKTSQVGIAPLPNGGCVGGWLLAINKNSKNADGAWEFIKYVSGEAGQKIMSTKGGYLPGINALVDDPDVTKANLLLTMPGFKKALTTTISRPVSAQYSKTSDTIQINVHKYLSGGQDINATVTAVQGALK